MTQPVHASVVARFVRGQWRGVLLKGPSGAGKSTTALAMVQSGAQLVVDDQALVWTSGARVYARPHPNISGLIEVRGMGIAPIKHLSMVRVQLVIQATSGPVERLPEPAFTKFDDVALPTLSLDLRHPSSAQIVASALDAL